VAHLDVVAMYHQTEKAEGLHPSIDVLHVVARTRGAPHKYFSPSDTPGASTAEKKVCLYHGM
jgi:hypothetical protein